MRPIFVGLKRTVLESGEGIVFVRGWGGREKVERRERTMERRRMLYTAWGVLNIAKRRKVLLALCYH